jgi:hypothetical protein
MSCGALDGIISVVALQLGYVVGSAARWLRERPGDPT